VDTVRIELTADGATIEHIVPSVVGVIEAYAIRIPGQTLTVIDAARRGGGPVDPALIDHEGALRLAVASSDDVIVRYRVDGAVDRIPLFVPGGGAVVTVARALDEPWLIRVTGVRTDGVDTPASLPRFVSLDDGALEARLASLPSFVRLSGGGAFSFARLADAAAVLLVVCGGIVAFRRVLTAAREAR
ncbi:MAG: hypothetical protein R3195_16080, partial [Gemmatimonadota bacterium]|nr:hypothetical protein [Gemmatimonadota bacterium]